MIIAGIPVDPSYSPTPLPTTSSLSTKKIDPVCEFKKGIKRDPTLFPILTHDTAWHSFNQDLIIEAKAQAVEEILQPNYVPKDLDDKLLFREKQKFMTSVFKRVLKTDKGKSIITTDAASTDAQSTYDDLKTYHLESTQAEAEAENLLNYLPSSHINDGNWKGNAHSCLLHWEKQVLLYNEKSSITLSETHQHQYLQHLVAGIPQLAAVKNTAQTIAKATNQKITHTAHSDLLRNAAQQYDITVGKTHPTDTRRTDRKTHLHQQEPFGYETPDEMVDCNDHNNYDVNFFDATDVHDFDTSIYDIDFNQRDKPTLTHPCLPHNTWFGLTQDDQTAWDQLSNHGKASILKSPSNHPTLPPNQKKHDGNTQSLPPTRKKRDNHTQSLSPTKPFQRSINSSDLRSFISVCNALRMGSPDDFTDINDDNSDNEQETENDDLCAMLTKNIAKNNGKPPPPLRGNDDNIPGNIRRLLSKPDQE